MLQSLRADAEFILGDAIRAVQPDAAVRRALAQRQFTGRIILVAAGKAAWRMAKTADACLGSRISAGIVLTKYGYNEGPIAGYACIEAGHPLPDENSFRGTQAAIELVSGLRREDTVLLLLSGGGSALLEKPLVSGAELREITDRLLAGGADIVEMNTIRKRLSAVKGGRFAQLCAPAQVFSIVLSDILDDPLDMIASGPASADRSTCAQAQEIARRYRLRLSGQARACLARETPKQLDNVTVQVTGSVRALCAAAAQACGALGYTPLILTDRLCCEAREAGSMLASIARTHAEDGRALAYIAGGETVVHVRGGGKGGRNQEIALAAAPGLAGLANAAVFSAGSDGTDGPTDAAGGFADGSTQQVLAQAGVDIYETLQDNDAYSALERAGGLIRTGPTGTNVNDVSVVLIREMKTAGR